jgi:hypothetical protein
MQDSVLSPTMYLKLFQLYNQDVLDSSLNKLRLYKQKLE